MTIWHYGRPRIPYRGYERKGTLHLRAYVILAIINVIILLVLSNYQHSSVTVSTGNQKQSKEYSSMFLAPKPRTQSSSSGFRDPQWAEGSETLLIRTTATKARKKLSKLKKNVEIVRQVTEKAFKLTKNIKDVVVIRHFTENPFELAMDMSDEEVPIHVTKKDIKLTRDNSDVDVVNKNKEKTFELTKDISDVDVVSHDTKKDFKLTKDISDVDVVTKNNEKTFGLTNEISEVDVSHNTKKEIELTKDISNVDVVNNNNEKTFQLTKDISDVDVVSHDTKKDFKLTKDISDVDVINKNNEKTFQLTNEISEVDVVSHDTKKDIELTKDISNVDVVNKNNEKTFELTKNISNVDFEVVSHVTDNTFELKKDMRDVDVVSNVTSKTHRLPIHLAKNTSHVITKVFNLTKVVRHLCDLPSDGGLISVNTLNISLDDVEKKYPEVKFKGRYSPPDCLALQSVAIIVPYRDRKQNLVTFLNHMHAFLIHQKLEYGIFIVEQKGRQDFNRGKLFNVGFLEAGNWQCFIFHDIDLLPLDQRNFYSCDPRHPRLYDALKMLYGDNLKEEFKGNFGGVAAVTAEQFTKANGYSNGYWAWSGEDNDLYYRLTDSGYTVTQYNESIARYKAIKHQQKSRNPERYPLLLQTMKAFHRDGLSTLQYRVVSTTYRHLYTHIVVDVDQSFHDLQELFQEDRNFKELHEQFPVLGRHNSPP